jgi:hypothetical protein
MDGKKKLDNLGHGASAKAQADTTDTHRWASFTRRKESHRIECERYMIDPVIGPRYPSLHPPRVKKAFVTCQKRQDYWNTSARTFFLKKTFDQLVTVSCSDLLKKLEKKCFFFWCNGSCKKERNLRPSN